MTEKLYGKIFDSQNPKEVREFLSSIDTDKKLIIYDILGSIAHVKMLGKKEIIPGEDAKVLEEGLKKLLQKAKKNEILFPSREKIEDVHTFVTCLLKKELKLSKSVVDKLHTARSRNDQICLDTRMYCLDIVDKVIKSISLLQKSILDKAAEYKKVIMPVYTHLQPAQAIPVPLLFCAYLETLEKDKTRFKNARENTDVLSLGSCAVRGTAYPIDREFVAQELRFSKISSNSIEAISSRDFILEILSAAAILSCNLSRIAEDLILYSTYEFDFIKINEKYLTSSSMMPNKRNADTLELIRGFGAKALGAFVQVCALMKNLPHAYNRDMQLDKEALFSGTEDTVKCLDVLKGVFKTLKFNEERLEDYLAGNDFIFATDIAEFLGQKGLSYRKAHDTTAQLVKYCLKHTKQIKELSDEQLKKFSRFLDRERIKELTNPQKSIESVKSEGGASPQSVTQQLKKWEKVLK